MQEFKTYLTIMIIISALLVSCKITSLQEADREKNHQNEKYLLYQIDSLKAELNKLNLVYEPGKAYSRCVVPTTFETVNSKEEYHIYRGSDNEQDGVKATRILVKPAYTKWVKRKSSEICEAYDWTDDESCENWHLQELPAIYETFYLVEDTIKVKEYETQSIPIMQIVQAAYLTEEREFICPTVLHSNLIRKVQNALRENGYLLEGAKENLLDEVTKEALIDYQKKNGLGVGTITFETLKLLGVE